MNGGRRRSGRKGPVSNKGPSSLPPSLSCDGGQERREGRKDRVAFSFDGSTIATLPLKPECATRSTVVYLSQPLARATSLFVSSDNKVLNVPLVGAPAALFSASVVPKTPVDTPNPLSSGAMAQQSLKKLSVATTPDPRALIETVAANRGIPVTKMSKISKADLVSALSAITLALCADETAYEAVMARIGAGLNCMAQGNSSEDALSSDGSPNNPVFDSTTGNGGDDPDGDPDDSVDNVDNGNPPPPATSGLTSGHTTASSSTGAAPAGALALKPPICKHTWEGRTCPTLATCNRAHPPTCTDAAFKTQTPALVHQLAHNTPGKRQEGARRPPVERREVQDSPQGQPGPAWGPPPPPNVREVARRVRRVAPTAHRTNDALPVSLAPVPLRTVGRRRVAAGSSKRRRGTFRSRHAPRA